MHRLQLLQHSAIVALSAAATLMIGYIPSTYYFLDDLQKSL